MSVSYAVVQTNDQDSLEGGVALNEIELSNLDKTRERNPTFSPDIPDNAPTVLTFTGITVATKNSAKTVILDDISGSITGGFWAIMGASGSGKTTLLSTLSLRLDTSYVNIVGDFRINGSEYSKDVLKAMSGYVMQDDLLHAELTVYETLWYSAQLRMRGYTNEEKLKRIEEVLLLMGIDHCRDVIIGDTRKKGISGGERKRVSVAIELLNHPKLLFLDEPTSGLDSTTAFSVTKALKHLASIGECTVLCTIHQPMPKIFRLFDNLILMKKGKIVYQGQAMKSVRWLDAIDSPCPKNVNLADHLLNVVSPSSEEYAERLDKSTLMSHFPVDLGLGQDKPIYTRDGASNWFYEYYILTKRCFQQYYRRWDIILMNLCATVLIAIFIGFGFWHNIGKLQIDVKSYRPSLFFVMVNSGVVASLQAIATFPTERAIVLRERASGSYGVSSYFMARTTVDFIGTFWPPIVFSCIVYWAIDYQHHAGKFFMYMFFILLNTWAAISLGCLVVCLCVSVERSTIVLSFLFEVTRLFGGLYTNPKQLLQYPKWKFADALSYIKYAFVGVSLNEYHGLHFDTSTCIKGKPCTHTGDDIITAQGYDQYTIGECVGSLIGLIVGFRLLAYLALRYNKK